MHWQQGGEIKVEKSCIASLEPIPRVKGELVHFFSFFVFWGVWSAVRNRPYWFWWNRCDRFVPRVGTCSGGACICAGGAPICFGGLCSLLEHGFVSDVSSRCPCLRGSRLVFFK
jgi:hypothetical protein